ncbi:U-scoloptoxin(11)-Ssd2a-like [Littorina saxatilis]|uniref:U-scoloptoxin(11)-Ssd2a-like n=1 Tax=Littorina saxatilis TaxID=31220 RepID=UPI0038B47D92
MDAASGSVVCFLAICAAMLIVSSGNEKRVTKDCVGQHVCTTLMRYPDGYVADEGPNCFCQNSRQPACNSDWEDNSAATLTWQHYERSHWTVQYKFCTPLFEGKRECNPGERAATVATEIKTWNPDLAEPRCRCHNNLFQMDGWKRDGVNWKYFYSCEKVECTEREPATRKLPCAKIYLDQYKTTDKVLEIQFDCACPEGQMCPAHLKKTKEEPELKTDAKGSYVVHYCELNVKTSDTNKG